MSFIKASVVISTSPSTVSRKISGLEEAMGVRLFDRTTRRVELTEAGRLYYDQCVDILNHLADADAMVESMNSEPRGLLRVSFPVALGHLMLPRLVSDFLHRYPKVQMEVNCTDRYVDLVKESYDAAVRIGVLQDSGLFARRIATNRRLVVASPVYLERFGYPQSPQDLKNHRCLSFSNYPGRGVVWRFQSGDMTEEVKVTDVMRSDSSETIHAAATEGLGIAVVARYLCFESIESGHLVPLLNDWVCAPEAGVFIVHNSGRFASKKISVFLDYFSSTLKKMHW